MLVACPLILGSHATIFYDASVLNSRAVTVRIDADRLLEGELGMLMLELKYTTSLCNTR